MTGEAWLVVLILAAAVVLFVTEWLRLDVVALAVVGALMVSGVLTTAEALAGFSNPAVLTIAWLFVVGGAVLRTGLAGVIGRRLLALGVADEARLIAALMLVAAVLSSFMSDTGTVAVLLPVTVIVAKRSRVRPSRLLLPLSYGALFGGAMTLIGTPPNLIVNDLLGQNGLPQFTYFSFTPLGALLLGLGLVFLMAVGRRWLPDREPTRRSQRVATPEELVQLYRLPDNLFRLRLRFGSSLAGRTVPETELGSTHGLRVVGILREGRPLPPGDEARSRIVSQRLQPDDVLLVRGGADDVAHAAAVLDLGVQAAGSEAAQALIGDEVGVAEVILPRRSAVLGKTLVESRFGTVYRLTVLGIHRAGGEDDLDLKATRLQFGDVLLVQGTWRSISELRQRETDFIVLGEPEAMGEGGANGRAGRALLVLSSMLALMITGLLPVATASMLAALAMVLSGCLSMDDAYQAVDWRSIVLVAGMIPMSTALETVGLVDLAGGWLSNTLGPAGPVAVLGGLFLVTSTFTQVLSNTATAVVMGPIALSSAVALGVRPHAFLMAVAVAASMALASPVASPVNTLVMGAGDYRFSDYIRLGVPLILLCLAVSLLVLPLLFPFGV